MIERPTTVQGTEIADFSILSLKRDHHITSPTATAQGSLERSRRGRKTVKGRDDGCLQRNRVFQTQQGSYTHEFSTAENGVRKTCTNSSHKIPAWGGGGLEVPELRSYWQLITTGRGRVSFL